ncbi:MAG: PEP-CTERM sorting domain-containing protein [Planctomycetota bacterium]|jgi:hypothetical protein
MTATSYGDVEVGPDGKLYVADIETNNILVFAGPGEANEGEYLGTFGTGYTTPRQLTFSDEYMFVAHQAASTSDPNAGVMVFDLATGDLVTVIPTATGYVHPDTGEPIAGVGGRGVAYIAAASSPSCLLGDANGDGRVGIADLSALADNYGATGATWRMGDFNGDGDVGIADLSALADNYGKTGDPCDPDAMTVPEPATLALLAVSGLAVLRRRR